MVTLKLLSQGENKENIAAITGLSIAEIENL